MKIDKYFLDDLGNVYELQDNDRHECVYVRLLYKMIGHKSKIGNVRLDERVEV